MEIRLAAPGDLNPICGLYDEFFAYNAKLQPKHYRAGKEDGEYPKSVIEGGDSDIFIAVEDGAVCGLIHVRRAQTPPYNAIAQYEYAEIVDLIVTASRRRKGIGSALMEAARRWGRERNLAYIELFVLSEAGGEFLFYEREGFVTVSRTMRCAL